MKLASYRELKVWQSGIEVAQSVYTLSQGFPKDELYGLTSQMRRAAVSVPANIAEGHARDSTKEFLHHISIALGSLAEVEMMLTLAETLGYCQPFHTAELFQRTDEEGKMLRGLQKRLKSKTSP
jgi:four helix bundle protein